jgi:hypothetical protein
MKYTASLLLALLAMTVIPAFAHAGDLKDGKVSKKAAKAAPKHKVTYYYITDRTVVGSNIPIVVRKCGTDIDTSAPVTTYTQHDLDRTGGDSIGSDLVKTDPAIMFGHR